MKKIFLLIITVLMSAAIFASCGNAGQKTISPTKSPAKTTDNTEKNDSQTEPVNVKNIENMKLSEILDIIYEKTGMDPENFYLDSINEENRKGYLGTDVDFIEGIASEPSIGCGYSVCLVRVDKNKLKETADRIYMNANPNKWVCVTAENTITVTNGNVILLVMSSKETCDSLSKAFLEIK